MIHIFNKTFSLSTLLNSITLLFAVIILFLNIVYVFAFGENLFNTSTFLGIVLFCYAVYQLWVKKPKKK